MADKIRLGLVGDSLQPTFETAVDLHRLIGATTQAADSGRAATYP